MTNEMTVRISKAVLRDHLQVNRKRHQEMVKEAREGYLKKAEKALQDKLKEIRKGTLSTLQFYLSIPEDRTQEYDTVIGMLTMCTDETIVLTTADYRRFMEDKWEWAGHFLMANAVYSDTCRRVLDNPIED